MNEKELAIEIKKHSLNAIEILWKILNLDKRVLTQDEFEWTRRGVGISVGNIQSRLLDHVYEQYPELDETE